MTTDEDLFSSSVPPKEFIRPGLKDLSSLPATRTLSTMDTGAQISVCLVSTTPTNTEVIQAKADEYTFRARRLDTQNPAGFCRPSVLYNVL